MLKDQSIVYMWLLTMQGNCIWENVHTVTLQVSFPASVALASHFYVLYLPYRIQYDLQNLLLFFSKLLLNFYALSQNGVFIPLMATIMVVTHSERWSPFQEPHPDPSACFLLLQLYSPCLLIGPAGISSCAGCISHHPLFCLVFSQTPWQPWSCLPSTLTLYASDF